MPDNRYAQKGPINGGDDDSSGSAEPEAPKKLDMRKYINKPDLNIRDLFWTIMLAYAAKENVKEQLKSFHGQRMALLRVAVSVIQQPDKYLTEEMEPSDVADYTLRMILDEEWKDVFAAMLSSTYNMKDGVCFPIVLAMKKLCNESGYLQKLIEYAREIILEDMETEALLAYVAEASEPGLSEGLKNELVILAAEGLDQVQHYAMFSLKPLVEKDEKVQGTLITLMDSWDDETRRIAAKLLVGIKSERAVLAAKRQLDLEDMEETKELLKRITGKTEGEK